MTSMEREMDKVSVDHLSGKSKRTDSEKFADALPGGIECDTTILVSEEGDHYGRKGASGGGTPEDISTAKPRTAKTVDFSEEDLEIEIPNAANFKKRLWHEQGCLFRLTVPIISNQFLNFLLNVVDLAMVGHLGRHELAAAGLGLAYYNVFYYPLSGAAMALDTLLSQSFGAGQHALFGEWLVISLIIMFILCIMCAIAILSAETVLLGFGLDPALVAGASEFIVLLLPGLYPNVAFLLLTKYLQNQHILLPCVIMSVAANIFNIVCNYVMIYASGIGFVGAPIATSITRVVQFLGMILYLRRTLPNHIKTWPTWSLTNVTKTNVSKFCSMAFPGAAMIALEAWAFEVTYLMVAYLGAVELDAHTALLNMTGFVYMSFPLGLSIAASIRIGHLLGAGDPERAKTAGIVTIINSVCFMALLASIEIFYRNEIGWIYSSDPAVVALVSTLIPLAATFAVADGLQSALAGIFRGMGQQKLVVGLNMLGFWLLGLPVGVAMTFFVGADWDLGRNGEETEGGGIGVSGVYWGLNVGLLSTGIVGSIVLSRIDWGLQSIDARRRVGLDDGPGGSNPPRKVRAKGLPAVEGNVQSEAGASLVANDGCA